MSSNSERGTCIEHVSLIFMDEDLNNKEGLLGNQGMLFYQIKSNVNLLLHLKAQKLLSIY